ncbi:hypothetical protein M569_10758, partial [Genlisea aurea]
AKSAMKPLSMPTAGCFISFPTSIAFVSIPSNPTIKCNLSCSAASSLLPILRKQNQEPILGPTAVAAQRKDGNPVLLEDQEFEGNFNWVGSESAAGGSEDVVDDEGDYVEPPEEAKLYVGNLPFDVDSERLAKIFEEAGVVEIAEVIYNRDSDQSRGFGFVTMSSVEEAERAVEMFNRYDLGGRFLTVNKASPRGSKPDRRPPSRVSDRSNKIYVGNLAWSVTDEKLEQVFSEHGKVVSAQVVSDRETGRSRGFGFVAMETESERNEAIASLDGQNLDGRALRVNVAEDRPRR